jgi:hypothetical protein
MAKRNGGIIGPSNVPTGQYGGTASGVWRLRDAFNYQKAGLWPGSASYPVGNSARFNSGSSDYLSRATGLSSTSTTKATFSTWLKRSYIGSNLNIFFGHYQSNSLRSAFVFDGDVFRFFASPVSDVFITNQVFRDSSAWYHIVLAIDTTQATAANRVRLYLNGTQITSFSSTNYPTQNATDFVPTFGTQSVGCNFVSGSPEYYFNGYMAETNLIDGLQLTPSSFGKTDSATGIWTPLPYTGSYGTNGFYLKFANSAALGTDSSGNANTFTANNLTSVDQSTDTPTNNFCTLNPLNPTTSVTFSNGNLTFTNNATGQRMVAGTIGVSTGKWYAEVLVTSLGGTFPQIGIVDVTQWAQDSQPGANTRGWGYLSNGTVYNSNSSIDTGEATYTNSDIISIAMDLDNNKLYFAKNGTYINSGVPTSGATGTGAYSITSGVTYVFSNSSNDTGTDPVYEWNFGSPPFTIASGNADANGYGNFEYAVPSGYYALCTKNLATYG